MKRPGGHNLPPDERAISLSLACQHANKQKDNMNYTVSVERGGVVSNYLIPALGTVPELEAALLAAGCDLRKEIAGGQVELYELFKWAPLTRIELWRATSTFVSNKVSFSTFRVHCSY